MSVTVVKAPKQQGGILGTLGTLAGIGGAAFGMPWLSTLGMGMRGVDALMNGGGSQETIEQTGGALGKILGGLKDVWTNPADGNIAKTDAQKAAEKLQNITGASITGAVAGSFGRLPSVGSRGW